MYMKKSFLAACASVTSLSILSVFAQGTTAQDVSAGINTFSGLINLITTTIVKSAGTLLLAIAVVAFFFGIVRYIWGLQKGDTNETKNGQQFMIWGLVGLFVMFSVYGIIKFGQGILFNGRDINTITIPDINLGGSSMGNPSPTNNTGSDPFAPSTPTNNTGGSFGNPSPTNNTGSPVGDIDPNASGADCANNPWNGCETSNNP